MILFRLYLTDADRSRFIDFAKKHLTDRQKCYIIKYYIDGYSEKEIALLYGVSPSTVSRTLKRAVNRLSDIKTASDHLASLKGGGKDKQ